MNSLLRDDALEILRAGVERVAPDKMIRQCVKIEGATLIVQTETQRHTFDLDRFNDVLVVGAGKATAPMAREIEALLGDRISGGAIAVKAGHTVRLDRIRSIEAGHPVPNEASLEAGRAIAELAASADERTLVINLISGGGSALLTLPYADTRFSITLEEMKATTSALLRCGATIQEINCIRKHLSAIKGGRLARMVQPATSVSLILSDVVGDDLSSIASGLTVADDTTFADAAALIRKYGIRDELPTAVMALIEAGIAGEVPDTPDSNDSIFSSVFNVLIGTNAQAVATAAEAARRLGYTTSVITSQLTGEAREVAKLFVGMARDITRFSPPEPVISGRPACIIAGGETTVTIRGDGKGGRNQEMALAFLAEVVPTRETLEHALFLSGATDGNDGPTDAAGGLIDSRVIAAARSRSAAGPDASPVAALARNDAYHYLEATGGLVKTGPTNTNVCDIQILLVR